MCAVFGERQASLIPDSQIEELKRSFPLWRLAQEYIPDLSRDGAEYKGLCPFHQEKTPSFTIFQKDGVWIFKCFGCQETGNIFQFVQKTDKVPFKKAVEIVASKSEAQWQDGKQKVEQTFVEPIKKEKKIITFPLSILAEAEKRLERSSEALEWLAGRGITLETAKKFHLGYTQNLQSHPYHAWTNDGWIVFPTFTGDTITLLKYRSVKGKKTKDGEPAIFRKKDMATDLYNADAIQPFDDLFVVEGEPDCMIMVQAGFPSVSLPSAGFTPTPEMRDKMMQANAIFLAGDMDNVGRETMTKLWTELRDRTYRIEWPEGFKDANEVFLNHCGGNIEKFKGLVESLKRKAVSTPMPFMFDLSKTMLHMDITSPMDNLNRLRFPWTDIDKWVAVLPGDVMCMFATESKTGKALKNGTKVLTPIGFVSIESLKMGDSVIGKDGKETKVLGVFPQGLRPVYELTFSCGTKIICDESHLWTLETANHRQIKTFTTRELKGKKFSRVLPWRLPFIKPVQFKSHLYQQPLHPYLLGALLGDGGFTNTSIQFSSLDDEILNRIDKFLPLGITRQHVSGCDWRLSEKRGVGGNTSELKDALRFLKLLGLRSEEKFIPEFYMYGTIEQRQELLRGLLDTDGTVDRRKGNVTFCSSSLQLAEDVKTLVFSLGGFASISLKPTKCLMAYIVSINLPKDMRLFWLERKHKLTLQRKGRRRVRALLSVTSCGEAETTCIKIAAEDGLFIIENFIPTHNTTWLMGILLENAMKHNRVVVNYSAEVLPEQYARRAASYITGHNREKLTSEDFSTAAEAMEDSRFYNGYKPGADWRQVIELLKWAKRRLGADILVVDHIHFLTRGEKDETKAQSEAMRALKDLALEYHVIVIVVGQPRKAQSGQRGREAVTQDAKGSEAFGSDASQVFILHRDRKSGEQQGIGAGDDIYDPITKVKLDYSRESQSRVTKLLFRGDICRFFNITTQESSNASTNASSQTQKTSA